MKVSELIARLADLDPELNVYIDGYEGGYDDLEDVREITVMRDLNDSEKFWWDGPHDYDPKGERAAYLPRANRYPKT